MAWKHRKLFPTQTNQTQDCSGLCDPACPYNCYTNYPDYYLSPPPPPSSTVSDHSGNHISSYLIILVSLFSVIFLLIGLYVVKLKCYAAWCGRRQDNRSARTQSDNEFVNENQVDHPVWLIATVGLQQSIINSITACRYRKGDGLIEGTECSVCLNEFQEGETLRLLPKCSHAFHIPCIDTWLRSHTNCPLCRASIVNVSGNNAISDARISNSISLDQETSDVGGGDLGRNLNRDRSRNDRGLSGDDNLLSNSAMENSARTGEAGELVEFEGTFNDELNSKERANSDTCHNVSYEVNGIHNDKIQDEIVASSNSREPETHSTDHIEDSE
ncbi:hypothetical protein PIB30_036558 [Stylosanthes scabra]|uniref:RING-type E3 ubiquitin transferase n=1 Tax=Stylosanthes scabra TaxID=79078 RepID=A0ABU6WBR8_9FABA|nr:hypothetical protein [Stylosanthes scabra]